MTFKMIAKQAPIGIFDSGCGGLTILQELRQFLPNEHYIYFGDTLNLPYGDKSSEELWRHSSRIMEFFLKREVKLVVVACNSVTAAVYDRLVAVYGTRVELLNVVDPLVGRLENHSRLRLKIGLIGTAMTVNSRIFETKLHRHEVRALPTPKLVPLIEEGQEIEETLYNYLSATCLQGIDLLVLGCTHYPLIKERILKFYGNLVPVIDATAPTCEALRERLRYHEPLSGYNGKLELYFSRFSEHLLSFLVRQNISINLIKELIL